MKFGAALICSTALLFGAVTAPPASAQTCDQDGVAAPCPNGSSGYSDGPMAIVIVGAGGAAFAGALVMNRREGLGA